MGCILPRIAARESAPRSRGERLFDRFRIDEVFGGGMATVYAVTDAHTGRRYALKTVRPGADAAVHDRFREEARTWTLLGEHPHVVQAFWLIVMPLSSPGIIATAIYAFIGAWNEYVYAFTFLNTARLKTLPVGLQDFFTEFSSDWPGLMAASFIMSVPVVVLFLLLQKYFVRALTEGAVKT